MKADKKLTAVIFLSRGTQRHLAAISGGGRRHPRPVDWAGEMVSFSLFREGLDMLLLQNIYIYCFNVILNSIYFQAIQTAVFYQKNMYKMFRPNFLMF